MHELEAFKLIERISSVLRSEERKKYAALGLQPVHGNVLEYLAQCNRYSDTHTSVAEYLNLSKGTVSQSIQILERKQYLQKTTDVNDGRVVHLSLTEKGHALLNELKPLEIFKHVAQGICDQAFDGIKDALQATLTELQKANDSKSFGLCRTCMHFKVVLQHYECGLTNDALGRNDTDKICRNHALVTLTSSTDE